MADLNYRMLQRRGKESDLPSNPRDGEIYITTDTNTMYFGISGQMNKVPTMRDISNGSGGLVNVDNTLTSTSTTDALSANMGRELKSIIDNHTQNSFMHVTTAEKNQWNAKAPTIVASATTNGLMTSDDKIKLNGIAIGATNTVINNTLTSTSTTEALSANQGRILKDMIDSGGGGSTVAIVDNLTSTDTASALSANQGRIIKGLIDDKADKTTATTSNNGLMSASDKQKLDNISGTGGTTVVNTLTSTSTSDALSAYQGKLLNEAKVNGYQDNVALFSSNGFGWNTTARGYCALVNGIGGSAFGSSSFANGTVVVASGDNSFANGNYTEATNYSSTALGNFSNMTLTDGVAYNSSAQAFVIGNGTSSSSRSNAFRVNFNGQVYGRSAYNSSGADYAEYFEWLDGNVANEDRVGYFVTLKGKKIRKANSTDDYILGIVSATPSVIGNSASEGWNEQYVKDKFGRVQYHYIDVEYEELDKNGDLVKVIKSEYHPIYNPNYDPKIEYISREERPEWDAVGMLGQLYVYDDGTCEIDGYCKSNNNGMATKSESGYRVLERISENIVQVLVK